MNNIWKPKFEAFIHSTSVFYKRLYFALLAVTFGTALLSLLSLIDFIKKLVNIARMNPNSIFIIGIIFVILPTLAFMLDKRLGTNVNKK